MVSLYHPLTLFVLSNAVVSYTAAFTDRSSHLRYVAVIFLLVLAYVIPISLARFVGTTGWLGRVAAGSMFWNCIICFDRLILREWDYEHYGSYGEGDTSSEDATKGGDTRKGRARFTGTRMEFGSEVSGLARGVGRFWQVKNVPCFSNQNPELVPTTGAFILVQILSMVACYYFNNLTVAITFNLDSRQINSGHEYVFTRLAEISKSELQVRAIASIGYWVIQYCNMQFFYSLFSLVGAISSPKQIKYWRPLFGNPEKAYSLRNYWGIFWHQTLRSGLEGVSNYITHDLLQLPTHGVLQRYSKIFFAFALSGVMHIFADAGGGLPMRQSGALWFFSMQVLGIMIEDGVLAIYRRLTGSKRSSLMVSVERAVGYVWVVFFLIWTSPVWIYPVTLQMKEEDALLSLVALEPLWSGRAP